MIKRNNKFIEVVFFYQSMVLKTDSWKDACRMFYEQLSDGRNKPSYE